MEPLLNLIGVKYEVHMTRHRGDATDVARSWMKLMDPSKGNIF